MSVQNGIQPFLHTVLRCSNIHFRGDIRKEGFELLDVEKTETRFDKKLPCFCYALCFCEKFTDRLNIFTVQAGALILGLSERLESHIPICPSLLDRRILGTSFP